MGRPITPKRGYRTMTQERVSHLNREECLRGINSCKCLQSTARGYEDSETVERMETQIGAFEIQMDMLASGDIEV